MTKNNTTQKFPFSKLRWLMNVIEARNEAVQMIFGDGPQHSPGHLVSLVLSLRASGFETRDSTLRLVLDLIKFPGTVFARDRVLPEHCRRAVEYAWSDDCTEWPLFFDPSLPRTSTDFFKVVGMDPENTQADIND